MFLIINLHCTWNIFLWVTPSQILWFESRLFSIKKVVSRFATKTTEWNFSSTRPCLVVLFSALCYHLEEILANNFSWLSPSCFDISPLSKKEVVSSTYYSLGLSNSAYLNLVCLHFWKIKLLSIFRPGTNLEKWSF